MKKKASLINGLYAITPNVSTDFVYQIEQALKGGAKIIQYRDKVSESRQKKTIAHALRVITKDYNASLIINDDVTLASEVEADGVHLGIDDMSIAQAREILGDKIIGISCYNKLSNALEAQKCGADYVAFGSFFSSGTKPNAVGASLELLATASNELSIPIVAIGGITLENAGQVITAGADAIAVIQGLFNQENIEEAARRFSVLVETPAFTQTIRRNNA